MAVSHHFYRSFISLTKILAHAMQGPGANGYIVPFPNLYTFGPNIKGFAKAGATNYFPEGEASSNGNNTQSIRQVLAIATMRLK